MPPLPSNVPRYLVNFAPKNVPHCFADVLIIGGGLAGLRAALSVDPSQRVLVVTKDKLRQSNSTYAQGGIAGVIDPDDKVEWHVRDTMQAGGNLCHLDVVESVISQAPERIRELIEMGTEFDQEQEGLTLGREGGHSHNRIIHARGDATGEEVMRAVIRRIHDAENIQVIEDTFTLDLLTHEGACRGAIVVRGEERTLIWSKQTILCTGGAGQLFRETTNPAVATADGHAMAFRAGAEVRDMEFMQFHPTVLYIAGSSRSLITEAVRGEGAWLIDSQGKRFMSDYDSRLELAPRDVVSQAIASQMEKTHASSVFLSLKHLDPDHVRKRFPGITKAVAEFGLEITTDPIPVRPGAHYMIGGVTVDHEGRTSLPNLWAAGEVTSSGLHGANRLASNSLLEGLVYGKSTGIGASAAALKMEDSFQIAPISYDQLSAPNPSLDLSDIRNSLKSLMWRCAGVRRDEKQLKAALDTIESWQRYVLASQCDNPKGWELQNMLIVAHVIAHSALHRTESRGVHLRTDFQETDDAWRKHVSIMGERTELTAVPAPG